jgi:branched-chain amino acid transport system permease protein
MVVFSVIIMIVVLFYRQGIMGDRELNSKAFGDIRRFFRRRFGRKKEVTK